MALTSKEIEIIDASCASDAYYIMVRNLDQSNGVKPDEIEIEIDGQRVESVSWDVSVISPEGNGLATVFDPIGEPGSTYRIGVIGPNGRLNQIPVSC